MKISGGGWIDDKTHPQYRNVTTDSQTRHAPSGDTLDEQFEALSHPARRRILTTLVETNLREERGGEGVLLTDFTRDEIGEEIRLHHTHLPKLDRSEFINWDRDSKMVTGGARLDKIAPLVELMIAHEDELPADWL